jgi:hypothetical protein
MSEIGRLSQIASILSAIDGVKITTGFIDNAGDAIGRIAVKAGAESLPFEVVIKRHYPMQFHGQESIKFYNRDLIDFGHVMKDGNICIHTSHSPSLKEKLYYDVAALKRWVSEYFVDKKHDEHYEHIVVAHKSPNMYWFTDVGHVFSKDEYGILHYSTLENSKIDGLEYKTFLAQEFETSAGKRACNWSSFYGGMPRQSGFYIFIENPPATRGKFAIENWLEFEPYMPAGFIKDLHKFHKNKGKSEFPLFIGYRIPGDRMHWVCVQMRQRHFATSRTKIPSSKEFEVTLRPESITWAHTENCSYDLFFGRGGLSQPISQANILVIGVGAVGSILSRSLVRGGARKVTLVDHDDKHAGNVCRSEFEFSTGRTMKIAELTKSLTRISPFVEISSEKLLLDAAKVFLEDDKYSESIREMLNKFDIVFDCSTDDDIAYVLEQYKLRAQVFSLSITNGAKELMCATSPNLYHWVISIAHKLSKDESLDSFNPTGCWDPTFKASHNQVSSLVQFALRQIDLTYRNGLGHRTFFLDTGADPLNCAINLNKC